MLIIVLVYLLLGMFMLMIGNGLQGTLLGVRGGAEGFSDSTLGFVMAGYFMLKPLREQMGIVGGVMVAATLGLAVRSAWTARSGRPTCRTWQRGSCSSPR